MTDLIQKKQSLMQQIIEKPVAEALVSQEFKQVINELKNGDLTYEGKDINKFVANVLQAVRSNKDLMLCETKSLVYSIITSIQVGLEVDARKLSYLVPYKGQCTFIPSYQGYIYLIKKDLDVDNVESELIYDCDEFLQWKDENGNHFKFIPNYEKRNEKSKVVKVFSVVRYKKNTGREIQIEVMTYEEIKKLVPIYASDKFWGKHEHEMLRKTPVRRLGKWFSNNSNFALLNAIDNSNEEENLYYDENGEVLTMSRTKQKNIIDVDSLRNVIELEKK